MGINKMAIGGTLVGLTIGALAGVLLAPKSGRDLRKDIGRRSRQARDQAKTKFSDTKKSVSQWAEELRQAAADKADEIKPKKTRRSQRLFSTARER